MPSLTTSWPGIPLIVRPWKTTSPDDRPQQAGDGAQRGRLAGAVGPDQGHDLAGVDDEVQLLDGGDVAVVDADALQFEDRLLALAARAWWARPGVSTLILVPLAFAGAGLAEVGLDHLLVVADVVGRAFGDHRPAVEDGDPLTDLHDHGHVVLDQQHRDALLVADPVDELVERGRLLRVHAGRRLVQQQDLGPQGHGARDLQPALVAVGEVAGQLALALADAHVLQQLAGRVAGGALLPALAGQAEDGRHHTGLEVRVHRHHDVLLGGHQVEQPDVLERPGQPHRRPQVRLDAGDVRPSRKTLPDVTW